MKLMYYILFAVVACVFLPGCEKNENGFYEGDAMIYFPGIDDVNYSFVGKAFSEFGLDIPVKITGYRLSAKRTFSIRIIEGETTAVPGRHYEELKSNYSFDVNTFEDTFKVVLLNHVDLQTKSYVLTLELVDDNLKVAYNYKAKIKIVFANMYIKPAIWDAIIANDFGVYSKRKHEICMMLNDGIPFPDTELDYKINKVAWLNRAWRCNQHFALNVETDEYGNRIMPWM